MLAPLENASNHSSFYSFRFHILFTDGILIDTKNTFSWSGCAKLAQESSKDE